MATNGKQRTTLSDDVLAAFERACDEHDMQVAEHLLRALEVIGSRDEGKDCLEKAYLDLAAFLGTKPAQ